MERAERVGTGPRLGVLRQCIPFPRVPFLETVHRATWWGWGRSEAPVQNQEKVSFQLLPQARHLPLPSKVGAVISASVKCDARVGVF